jgi:hypothetical protein
MTPGQILYEVFIRECFDLQVDDILPEKHSWTRQDRLTKSRWERIATHAQVKLLGMDLGCRKLGKSKSKRRSR